MKTFREFINESNDKPTQKELMDKFKDGLVVGKDRDLFKKSKDVKKISMLGKFKEFDGEKYTQHEVIFKDHTSIFIYM